MFPYQAHSSLLVSYLLLSFLITDGLVTRSSLENNSPCTVRSIFTSRSTKNIPIAVDLSEIIYIGRDYIFCLLNSTFHGRKVAWPKQHTKWRGKVKTPSLRSMPRLKRSAHDCLRLPTEELSPQQTSCRTTHGTIASDISPYTTTLILYEHSTYTKGLYNKLMGLFSVMYSFCILCHSCFHSIKFGSGNKSVYVNLLRIILYCLIRGNSKS